MDFVWGIIPGINCYGFDCWREAWYIRIIENPSKDQIYVNIGNEFLILAPSGSFLTLKRTRVISIESQPKKVVVVVVVVVVVFVVVIIIGRKNLTLKFNKKCVNNKFFILVVFFIVLVL